MKQTDVVIIGGGQAGLAMSRSLSDLAIDHVVVERGRVAERWRSERWDSLRLLSPKWQTRLPGFRYDGRDPDGFMTMPEMISFLERYAGSFAAPIQQETTVLAVRRRGDEYRVQTDQGPWQTPNVVIATGHCDTPFVPAMANGLSRAVHQIVPSEYRNPDELPPGEVIVVGASASGIQLALEVHRSGRPVTLAVGRHTRVPRRYRGRDISWWLEHTGIWGERAEDAFDIGSAREQPSLQLVGSPDHRTIDLGVLQNEGVRLVGRAEAEDRARLYLRDDLPRTIGAAERKLDRVIARIDAFIAATGGEASAPDRRPSIEVRSSPTAIDLRASGVRTIVWATGYRRRYPWLAVPVLDAKGELVHRGGVTPSAGLYALGLNFLRRRKSSFIDGVGDDARALAHHIASRFANSSMAA